MISEKKKKQLIDSRKREIFCPKSDIMIKIRVKYIKLYFKMLNQ